ncbi:MAG: hypothetical protein JNG90_06730 [Planctomycetaceae bacterium]|nr:hypothetical protein [Planctomycetaceae bacterium]
MRTHLIRLARCGVVTLGLVSLDLVALDLGAERSRGAEFRIQTSVFMGNEKTPASSNLTLFTNDVVYDYIAEPQEVTVFDPRRGRFVLLDVERQIRTQIPTKDVARNMQELRVHLANTKNNAIAAFFSNPQFESNIDPDTKELVLTSPIFTYRVTPLPVEDSTVLQTYVRFANSYAQLNQVTKPASPPPFPRMAVNEILKGRGVIPAKIVFTASNPAKLAANKSVTLKSVHAVQWKLFADDRKQIEETGRQLVTFREVPPEEYLRLTNGADQPNQQAARPAPAQKR